MSEYAGFSRNHIHQECLGNPRHPEQVTASSPRQIDLGSRSCCDQFPPSISQTSRGKAQGAKSLEQNLPRLWCKNHPRLWRKTFQGYGAKTMQVCGASKVIEQKPLNVVGQNLPRLWSKNHARFWSKNNPRLWSTTKRHKCVDKPLQSKKTQPVKSTAPQAATAALPVPCSSIKLGSTGPHWRIPASSRPGRQFG